MKGLTFFVSNCRKIMFANIKILKGRAKSFFSLVLLFFITVSSVLSVSGLFERKVSAETISGSKNNEISVDFTGMKEGYSSVLYNNSNGLPTSEANALAETAEGFIWIGSYSGLIKYDGNSFERIDSTTGITSVVSLYVDSKNRLWIGTNDNGVAVMDKGEFRIYKDKTGLKSFSVRSITEDSNGNIYIATTHGISVIDEEMNISILDETQINNEYVNELRFEKNSGIIYGETQDGAVFTIENGHIGGFYDGARLGINDVNTILPDAEHEGYVYIGTSNSEIYYGNLRDGMSNAKKINVAPLTCINSLESIGGMLWVCSDSGIGEYSNGKFSVLENISMNNSVDHMMPDYEGNLWFSSSRQGVLKIVPNMFLNFFDKYDIEENVVNSTCRYDNNLFIGTDTGLIIVDANERKETYPIKSINTSLEEYEGCTDLLELLDGCRIRSIIKDSKDRIWFSTFSQVGLVKYDKGNVTTYNSSNGFPSDKFRVVFERNDGKMLVACTGGMTVLGENGVEDIYDEKAGLSNPEVLTIAQAKNGDVLLGSDGDGIYVIKDHEISNIGIDNGLSSQVVMRIKRDDKRNIFWIVTSNSIAYMNENYEVTTVQKFPYSNNFDMYENSRGEMWVLSSNGIYVVNVDELLANEEIRPVFYNRDNGLPCVATANSYSALTDDGVLYIAGSTGVARVDIEKEFEDVKEVKMAVPYVEADGELLYPDDSGKFTIPAKTKRLRIFGYAYTYSLLNPEITYYLEGFEHDSTTVSRSAFEPVNYTNLKGGDYTFVMSLHDSFGRGSNELRVNITKEKAIYETAWFVVMMVFWSILLIAIIAGVVVRIKTKSLEKKQRETQQLIDEIIEAFAMTIDMKDKYTRGHSKRVAEYTADLARELGYDEETVTKYHNIALLHDIGKLGIDYKVLNKDGKLSDEEFTIIKSHSIQGYNLLRKISIMPELAIGAKSHHERPDGRGYPEGLKGEEIPRVAQIIAVADTFDAMYSDRPYRKRMNFDRAVSIIKEVSGTQLQSDVVDAFLRLVDGGFFKAEDDEGGGTTEDINNIHKKFHMDSDQKDTKESDSSEQKDTKESEASEVKKSE